MCTMHFIRHKWLDGGVVCPYREADISIDHYIHDYPNLDLTIFEYFSHLNDCFNSDLKDSEMIYQLSALIRRMELGLTKFSADKTPYNLFLIDVKTSFPLARLYYICTLRLKNLF